MINNYVQFPKMVLWLNGELVTGKNLEKLANLNINMNVPNIITVKTQL